MNHNHKAARQYSDQIHCSHCGRQWDVNDPDPPECNPVALVDKLDLMLDECETEPVVKTSSVAQRIKELRDIVHEIKSVK